MLGIAYGVGRFVTVGNNGVIHVSTNATDWRTVRTYPGQTLPSVAYGSGLFVALEGNSANALVSVDGLSWDAFRLSRVLTGVASAEGALWVFGEDGYKAKTAPYALRLDFLPPELYLRGTGPGLPPHEIQTIGSIGNSEWQVLTTFTNTHWFLKVDPNEPQRFYRIRAKVE